MQEISGSSPAFDKKGEPIIFEGSPVTLEWHKTTDHTTMVALQKRALPIVEEAFADEEIKFLLDDKLQIRKEYADVVMPTPHSESTPAVSPDSFSLDRAKRVEFSRHAWGQWFQATAQSMKDLPFTYFFVMAKNSKGTILGFTAFYISPMLTKFFPEFDVYTEGDVVLEPIAITPAAQGIGLARPLIFSILRLVPETKRILLGTRIWITNAIAMYNKFGFTEYKREGVNVKFKYQVTD